MRKRQFFSKLVSVSLVLIMSLLLVSKHLSVNAESFETTSHTYTLSEEISKVSYTDEEKNASGWDGAKRDANKQSLFEVAFAKSNLKFYAGAGNNADGSKANSWAVKEYYDWADDGNSFKWSYSAINGLSVGNNAGTEYGFKAGGTFTVGAMSYSNFWAIAWTAPANGTLTLPETEIKINSASNATLEMAITENNYLLPTESGWISYAETTKVPAKEIEVSAGDVVYINMYATGTASGRKVNITYNPTFKFVDANDKVEDIVLSQSTTLETEIAKVNYTDAEKIASGWDGTSRDANKKSLYQTAFSKSNLKFYAGAGNNSDGLKVTDYKVLEYYEWADNGSAYKWSYSAINGLSVGNNAGTEYGFKIGKTFAIGGMNYSNFWAIEWIAPADGTFVMPATGLTIVGTTGDAVLKLAVTKGDYLLPTEDGWTPYTETTTIGALRFYVSEGDKIYLNMYVDGSAATRKVSMTYDPTFKFIDGNEKAENQDVKLSLVSEIEKIAYTEDEKTASGWNGSTRDANKQKLYGTAFSKSAFKFYGGSCGGATETGSYTVKEYYTWMTDGNSWKWSSTAINGLCAGNNYWNELGFAADGKHRIYAANHSNFWAIAWTAPTAGTLTLPATDLTIVETSADTVLLMAVTKGDYLLPTEEGWTRYTESATIAEQTIEVNAGDVIYLNMYADGTAEGRFVIANYNPTFDFKAENDPCKLYGHIWGKADCDTPKTCLDCGITDGEALGHTPKAAVKENEVASTCKVAGSYDLVVYCSVCNEELSRTKEALELAAHKEVIDEAVESTCTEKGKTEGKHCSVCEEVLVAQEEVDALGHTNADAVKENEVASTCKVAGSYDLVVYCSVCNEELSRTTETLELALHKEVIDEAIAATCTEKGKTEGKHCSVCEEVLVAQEEVAALGHTNADAVKENEVASTCKVAGSYNLVVYCSVCNEELSRTTETLELLEHTEETIDAVAATCETTGLTEGKKCSVCDEVLLAQEEVAALGHTEVIDAAVAATCTEKGKTEGKHCSVCEKVLVAQEEVAALGHTYGSEYKYDETHHWNECSCGETNEKVAHSGGTATETEKAICEVCGQPYGELKPQANPLAGCTGSIVSTVFGVISLAGIVIVLKRKRDE